MTAGQEPKSVCCKKCGNEWGTLYLPGQLHRAVEMLVDIGCFKCGADGDLVFIKMKEKDDA